MPAGNDCPDTRLDQPEAAFCERFTPHLRGYIERHMGARVRRWVEPEDILQRTLLEVLAGLPRPLDAVDDDEARRRLQRTAGNRIADVARKRQRDVGESSHATPPDEIAQPVPSAGPVTVADSRRWLSALVERLPDGYRQVVERCALQGMTFVECAQDLGLEPDTARKRYHKARELLAAKLSARRHD